MNPIEKMHRRAFGQDPSIPDLDIDIDASTLMRSFRFIVELPDTEMATDYQLVIRIVTIK